ncbi:MAG: hypothetical protein KBB37_00135 [Bacteroidia bacterium]|nr:hypothetical protein [Bacteroidia bacterium]MBP7259666.1 hypothetical protein [Bacteroidia bacterium]MBP9179363.1 hypothetical protein [Bacteroidia bacterium]MBP9723383.1 hypothetical protein [Bacteroidia bacterium]
MKNRFALVLIMAAFSSLSIQCKEDEKGPVLAEELAKLPKATTEGYETFGCLLNGWAWPGGRKIYDYTLHIAYYNYNGGKRFNVMCYTQEVSGIIPPPTKDIVNIVTDDIITGPGEYIISLEDINTDFVAIKYKEIRYNSGFLASFGQKLHLNITRLDSINRIISGNFRISLLDYTGTKAMHLEYGRFDSYY